MTDTQALTTDARLVFGAGFRRVDDPDPVAPKSQRQKRGSYENLSSAKRLKVILAKDEIIKKSKNEKRLADSAAEKRHASMVQITSERDAALTQVAELKLRLSDKKKSHMSLPGEHKLVGAYVSTRASLQAIVRVAASFAGCAAVHPTTLLRGLRRCEGSICLRDNARIKALLPDISLDPVSIGAQLNMSQLANSAHDSDDEESALSATLLYVN